MFLCQFSGIILLKCKVPSIARTQGVLGNLAITAVATHMLHHNGRESPAEISRPVSVLLNQGVGRNQFPSFFIECRQELINRRAGKHKTLAAAYITSHDLYAARQWANAVAASRKNEADKKRHEHAAHNPDIRSRNMPATHASKST